MKNTIGCIIASAALASAQVTYNETDGTFTCSVPDKAYCAGNSLNTDIIIRCSGTKGQPGRCTDNLAGYPPLGVNPALCYQSSLTAGDAACEKNCVVYAPSSSFTLPASICTPYYTVTSSPTSSPTSHSATTSTKPPVETTTATTDCETTTTYKPTHPPHGHNSTVTIHPTGHTTKPIAPTVPTLSPVPTAGAAANKAAGALVAVGLAAAYFF